MPVPCLRQIWKPFTAARISPDTHCARCCAHNSCVCAETSSNAAAAQVENKDFAFHISLCFIRALTLIIPYGDVCA
jgi:hypothetical protein